MERIIILEFLKSVLQSDQEPRKPMYIVIDELNVLSGKKDTNKLIGEDLDKLDSDKFNWGSGSYRYKNV